ncbi:MAG: choline-sulfatase [Thermoleophilaceae bacterium]|nr:choline-sulfatase [Thermoleophilaceae bacterium]MEA2402234.1 choline-sulfatase [Thermoleophilaceae bacterium]
MAKPNLVLLVTDQQRAPQHWARDQAWLDELMPNDAELRRTGISFTRAFTATAMCSPSRASFLTGTYPSRHGVTLTLTEGDLFPDKRNVPDVLRAVARLARSGEVPRLRLARSFLRGLLRLGPKSGNEPELPPGIDTLATLLRDRGYHVALKGKWHLSKPVNGREWSAADPERIERDYGFADWEPPDAGGDAKAHTFGGGNAGVTHEGWDEDYTRQMEEWLAQERLPEPFCLVFSLVNPHDVLGYPSSFEEGGYTADLFRELNLPLPPTVDEDLREKPTVHSLMKLGQTAYIGALPNERARRDYVNFYAYLHRVVDEKIGRLLAALGDPADPDSLRSRTVIARTSDHGELGLSHGGLRQKMFNGYEESIRVPLVISNPVLFPEPRQSDALVSLVDLVPTLLGLSGDPAEPQRFDGLDLGPILSGAGESVRDAVLFTYDDHQAGTAFQDVPGQPNRIRCVRDARWKYAVYLDPSGEAAPEYELYDLDSDPHERLNLVDKRTGRGRNEQAERERLRLHERLERACAASGTLTPPLPSP